MTEDVILNGAEGGVKDLIHKRIYIKQKHSMKRIIIIMAGAALLLPACQEHEPETGLVMPAPENVRCTANAGNSLTFVWDGTADAEQYTARLVTTEDDKTVEVKYVTETTAVFNELEAGVSYTCKVRAVAGKEYSEFVSSEPVTAEGGESEDPDPDPVEGAYEAMMIPAAEDEHKEVLAFPGAEGGGMYVTGGRGGRIIHVTTLDDSGEGSLRAALNESGPRVIVFDVAGIIRLESRLNITEGDVTIAGQTAPGTGICIADNTVEVSADNVIIRFVRFRLGDRGNGLDDGSDAIWGRYHSDIILDHCSMSWSIDECASFYANRNFTMQWCIISEALRNTTVHSKGAHGYGGLWGGRNASFHHNLLAHNDSRNARIDHPGIYDNKVATHRGNVDFRNNVIYNWGNEVTYGGEDGHFNIVGNYYKAGPASVSRRYYVNAYRESNGEAYAYPELYLEDNFNSLGVTGTGVVYKNGGSTELETVPFPIRYNDNRSCYTTTHSAQNAFTSVTEYAGASLVRDAVDVRVTDNAVNGDYYRDGSNGSTKGMIDSQEDVGGWPEYSASEENEANDKADSDNDGIPDWFEAQFGTDGGLDPDGKTIDIYGRYTDFEMYLHYLVRDVVAGQAEGGSYTALE